MEIYIGYSIWAEVKDKFPYGVCVCIRDLKNRFVEVSPLLIKNLDSDAMSVFYKQLIKDALLKFRIYLYDKFIYKFG